MTDKELREAANHRGLKLVRSRKRTPGVGDYGMFGLTDASGKPLLGIETDGLTATADQIADFLRKGEASTWAESAKVTPVRKRAGPKTASREEKEEKEPPSAIRARPRRSAVRPTPRRHSTEHHPSPGASEHDKRDETRSRATPRPKPAPELAIRTARSGDAAAIEKLLGASSSGPDLARVKRAIGNAAKRGEPVLVADRGGVVGLLAWQSIATIHLGTIARITAIEVGQNVRREGIGTALFEALRDRCRKDAISVIEAMSDIEVRNANAFMRSLGLAQKSYRFLISL